MIRAPGQLDGQQQQVMTGTCNRSMYMVPLVTYFTKLISTSVLVGVQALISIKRSRILAADAGFVMTAAALEIMV